MPSEINPKEIFALVDQLKDLGHNPEQFAQTKRLLIDCYIASLPLEAQKRSRAFQQEVEILVAVSGTPIRAISMLMDEITDRCDAMDGFNDQLKYPS